MCTFLRDHIKQNEMGGAYSTYGDRKSAYMVSVVRAGGKKPLGRPISRWEDNIKMDF